MVRCQKTESSRSRRRRILLLLLLLLLLPPPTPPPLFIFIQPLAPKASRVWSAISYSLSLLIIMPTFGPRSYFVFSYKDNGFDHELWLSTFDGRNLVRNNYKYGFNHVLMIHSQACLVTAPRGPKTVTSSGWHGWWYIPFILYSYSYYFLLSLRRVDGDKIIAKFHYNGIEVSKLL